MSLVTLEPIRMNGFCFRLTFRKLYGRRCGSRSVLHQNGDAKSPATCQGGVLCLVNLKCSHLTYSDAGQCFSHPDPTGPSLRDLVLLCSRCGSGSTATLAPGTGCFLP